MRLYMWACTWNMSNTAGTKDEWKDIAAQVPSQADVIVLGLQEAARGGHEIMDNFRKMLPAYEPIDFGKRKGTMKHARMKCRTKATEPGYQGIGVLRRRNYGKFIGIEDTDYVKVSGGSGKGGCYVILKVDNAVVAVVSAHLPTGKRDAAALQVYNHVKEKYNPQATIFMGDLNYRLKLSELENGKYILPEEKWHVETSTFKRKKTKLTTASTVPWAANFATPKGRKRVFDACDQMHKSSLGKLGFDFPVPVMEMKPSYVAFPTYKRTSKGGRHGNPCTKVDTNPDMKTDEVFENFLSGWFGDKKTIHWKAMSRGGFDVGWLDRIGVLKGPGLPTIVANYDKAIALAKTHSSDHAPVCMTLELITSRPNLPNKIGVLPKVNIPPMPKDVVDYDEDELEEIKELI